jgi:hypothetical protein
VRRLALLPLVVLLAAPAGAQLSLDVNAAIARGVDVLREAQGADGSFSELTLNRGHVSQYPMGTAALAVYTLRRSGVRADDPAITSALAYLEELPPLKVYSAATLVFALDALGTGEHDERISELATWLEGHFDERTQQWGYPDRIPELSNTQFAVLAMDIASRHGHETPVAMWPKIIDGALSRQQDDGGFNYRDNLWGPSSGGMTTAGITTLLVARRQLEVAGQYETHQRKADAAIERAWAWLDARFSSAGCPAGTHGLVADRWPRYERDHPFHYYYLYGIERVATFAGRKTIGGLPWYPAGALDLLAHEGLEGGWGSLPNTCLALLFLRRATISGAPQLPTEATSSSASATSAASAASASSSSGSSGADVASGDGLTWAYTTTEPRRGWHKPGFDDGAWERGPAGFGVLGTSGLTVRTAWTTSDLWVRRSFTWSPGDELSLNAIHDDSVTIWINGELAAEGKLWSGGAYATYPLSKSVLRTLETGENVIAAHVHDTGGGRSLDIRLDGRPEVTSMGPHWTASLPDADVPYLRRWLVAEVADKDDTRMLDVAPPAEDARPGERLAGKPWQEVTSLAGRLDLGELADVSAKGFGVLATRVHAADDWEGWLWLGANGGVRAWLDGEPVATLHEHRDAEPDRLRARLELDAGTHLLMVGLETLDAAPQAFVRLCDDDGSRPDGLTFGLDAGGADSAADARAHAGLHDTSELAAALEPMTARALGLRNDDDLAGLAIAPVLPDAPRWHAKVDNRGAPPQPPTGGRGMLALRAANASTPMRATARVTLADGANTIMARVARTAGSRGEATVRLGVHDGGMHWLGEPFVLSGPADKRKPWQELSAPLGDLTSRDVLLILEVSAGADGQAETVFLDALELD